MIAALARTARNSQWRVCVILFAALCLPVLWLSFSLAQVPPPITSSGLNTQVNLSSNPPLGKVQYDITGGTRPGGGQNLFHSFGEFGVPTNNIANFLNETALPTSNILGRVTGGNTSNIFGTIQTTNFPGANLFLMNPAGWLFGPTATVNVGGMVAFTSADYLKLGDGVRFNAIPDVAADALLSAAPVAAFGFLGSNPGAITVQGSQLAVNPGQGIELIGGNITVQNGTLDSGTVQPAKLSAPAGQIQLASVASPGEILAGTLDQAPNVHGQSFGALGAIQVSQKSVIDASGDGGGTVLIRGGRFVLDNSTISANTTGPAVGPLVGPLGAGIDIQVSQDAVIQNAGVLETNVSSNVAPGIGSGGVRVKADRIEIVGLLPPPTPPFTGIRSNVAAGSTGNSGDITLEANSISLKNAATLQTLAIGSGPPPIPTTATGDAGNITLRTNQNIEMNGVNTTALIISQSRFASGDAGSINLTSTNGNITMTRATVTSQAATASGNVGTLTVSAPHGDILLNGPVSVFTHIDGPGEIGGSGGGVQVTANNLTLFGLPGPSGLSGIAIDNFNPEVPGNLTVNLSGSLSLSGNSFIQTVARGPALAAADLNITAHDVSITGGSFLNTQTTSSGRGGHLNIFAEDLQLTNGGQLRSGSTIAPGPPGQPPLIPSGPGGTITIQGLASPAGSVLIDGAGSGIFTNAQGTGAAGNTNIAAQSLTIQNGGTISALTSGTAPTAKGGDIAISADQFVTLNNNASVTASSTGPANAGDIVINAGQNYTSTNSSVTTTASQASGGNITVTAANMVQLTNSQINASVQGAQTTIGGNIVIDPQFVVLQNSQILAQAAQGQGGNITITTPVFLTDANSIVDASSQSGVNGAVSFQSPISQAGGKIVPLSKTTLETTALLGQRCAAMVAGGQFSSFVVAGREALPTEPGGWMMSPVALEAVAASPSAQGEGAPSVVASSVVASEGESLSLRRLPPGVGIKIFSTDWLAGCGS